VLEVLDKKNHHRGPQLQMAAKESDGISQAIGVHGMAFCAAVGARCI
jgi:hypothetical protein